MSQGDWFEFLRSSAAKGTRWSADRDTLICVCESCGAETRCGQDDLAEFPFAHKDSCPNSDQNRANRLVDEMATILEEETDHYVALGAITFLAASMCVVAAKAVGVPVDVMTKRFGRELERQVDDLGPGMQIVMSEEGNNAA
jgi:hypothetical protein